MLEIIFLDKFIDVSVVSKSVGHSIADQSAEVTMLTYFLGFLIYGFIGYAVSAMLLKVYEWNRSYDHKPLEDHARWYIRRAIKITSIGAGFVAGFMWILVHATPF